MASISVGVDCEEMGRFKKKIKDGAFLKRIYTSKEIKYCLSKPNPEQHLAARFAGKEAVMKALNGLEEKVFFHEIEILNDRNGVPRVLLKKKSKAELKISLSHTSKIAIAFVIAEEM